MADVFIVSAVRSPVAKAGNGKARGGYYDNLHPVHLLSQVLRGCVEKVGVNPVHVEDVLAGCVTPMREQGGNIGRLAALHAGFPQTVPGLQVHRACGSSQQSVNLAHALVASGQMDMVIACGVERMSLVQMSSDSWTDNKERFYYFNDFQDGSSFPYALVPQVKSAEMIADQFDITRQECDQLAVESHARCASAIREGRFKDQIVPIQVTDAEGKTSTVDTDQCVRPNTTLAKLGKLKALNRPDGAVTAGNASQIADGAAALLLCSGKKADELGLKKLARVVTTSVGANDPVAMLGAVIPATEKVLAKAGLSLDDMDCIEINEAFATPVLAWKKTFNPDMAKVNPNGGAMAHGHPLGATGAILMTKLVHELCRSKGKYGLQTMCTEHGMAPATIIERCDELRSSL